MKIDEMYLYSLLRLQIEIELDEFFSVFILTTNINMS